jgi:DNA-binding Xre family transcriptional regulator
MYIDYSKLWKLLIDKGISKTDLMELTGMSSRVLAKLSKNETVTTDTVARICSALSCDVGDIMECVSEKRLSVYSAFKKLGVVTEENDLFRTVRFTRGKDNFVVYHTKQTANKATHIECREDGTVYFSQFRPVGMTGVLPDTNVIIKPPRVQGEISIVLIKGKPAVITGLDENGFVSSRGSRTSEDDVYVMSEAAFKLFTPQIR